MGRNSRARVFRAALPCLALIVLTGTAASAQTVTPDLFSSTRTSQVTSPDSPLRRTAAEANDPLNSPKLQEAMTSPRRRGSDRSRNTACRPPAARPIPATTRSTASARNRNTIPGRRSRSRRSVPAVHRRRLRRTRGCGFRFRRRQSAHKTPIPPAMAGTVVGQPPRKRLQDRRRSVRRGRRLRRQLPDQIRGRTQRRLRHQSRAERRCRGDRRSM